MVFRALIKDDRLPKFVWFFTLGFIEEIVRCIELDDVLLITG